VCLEDQWKGKEAVKRRGLLIAAVKRNGGIEYKDLLRISVEKKSVGSDVQRPF
jgi:hypothetical protein